MSSESISGYEDSNVLERRRLAPARRELQKSLKLIYQFSELIDGQ